MSCFIIYTVVTTVKLVAFSMELSFVDTNGVCIDKWYVIDIFVFNIYCVDAFR